jgi:hypothetical protein
VTCGGIEIGATAVAPPMHPTDIPSEAQSLLPEIACACVQRPTQRLVTLPPDDDEAAIDR